MNRDGGVIDGGHQSREPWAAGVMPMFIPPAVFGEMEAIFDPPVVSDVAEKIKGANAIWIETGDEVPRVVKHDFSIVSYQSTIDPHDNFTIWQIERFSNVVGVV